MNKPEGGWPAYAWPGGYPRYYLLADGETMCPACANGQNGSEASADMNTEDQWRLVAYDINWEDSELRCAHCSARIESAYAEKEK